MSWRIDTCDVMDGLRSLEAGSVHCVVTSPPYFSLRDYGVSGQIGLEPTIQEYVAKMVEVFGGVRRVLRDDGVCWINLGDSYNNSDKWGGGGNVGKNTVDANGRVPSWEATRRRKANPGWLKCKDLCGIPWRVAFALQADGWFLRSDVIWSKPNPMPESVTDRPTKSHEYLFLLTKSARYFWDQEAVREANAAGTLERLASGPVQSSGDNPKNAEIGRWGGRQDYVEATGRNLRTVWTIATQPYPEAHFATYPEALVIPCIKAGTSERGCCPECGAPWRRVVERGEIKPLRGNSTAGPKAASGERFGRLAAGLSDNGHVPGIRETQTTGWQPGCTHNLDPHGCLCLDPFAGSGTTLLVARRLGCRAIGFELNPKYADMARKRIRDDMPLFNGKVVAKTVQEA